jgi:hypothetical protein
MKRCRFHTIQPIYIFVVQDAIAALGIAVDRAETPIATARRRDSISVQLSSNPLC